MRAVSKRMGAVWVLLLAAAVPTGCGAGEGGPAEAPAPEEVTRRLPTGAELLYCERHDHPMPYTLWIYHAPGADRLLDLSGMSGDPEGHELPGAVLLRLLEAKLPRFEAGQPKGGSCRFSHWTGEGVEYQTRELVTDRGWVASVEEMRPAG
ncbi:hypothetical protein [Tautonia sociabilis]|uniref:Lipoprotein n=1 Tax=Tautonia sociabilis TaxID=2080755 RepID=A0A432MP91_9BACT|nr:hypothetical protein [Tautonia sociabilis]RUL89079.1 hypothetical protein TsocGM_04290 [Tautonia sociabilis]